MIYAKSVIRHGDGVTSCEAYLAWSWGGDGWAVACRKAFSRAEEVANRRIRRARMHEADEELAHKVCACFDVVPRDIHICETHGMPYEDHDCLPCCGGPPCCCQCEEDIPF